MREAQFTTLITCPAYLDCRPDDRIEVSGYCARSSTELTYPASGRSYGHTDARPPERDSPLPLRAEPALESGFARAARRGVPLPEPGVGHARFRRREGSPHGRGRFR